MKNRYLLILIVIAFAALSSCVTQRACNNKFPHTHDTLRIITVKDSIIFKDTIIFINLPGENIIDSILIPCPEVPGYAPKKVYAETSLAKASAWWSFPNIKLELIQKDTTIEKRLDNAIKEAYHWQTLYEKLVISPEPEKYIPGFYKFCTFIFLGSVLAVILFVLFKIFK